MRNEIQVSSYSSQTFALLDKWLNQVGAQKGGEGLRMVKSTLQNNIKANIAYYESLAKEAESIGHKELAAKNRLVAELYKGLLPY